MRAFLRNVLLTAVTLFGLTVASVTVSSPARIEVTSFSSIDGFSIFNGWVSMMRPQPFSVLVEALR